VTCKIPGISITYHSDAICSGGGEDDYDEEQEAPRACVRFPFDADRRNVELCGKNTSQLLLT
jgi:hypothetical protein